jgi:hypothetical protein
MSLKEQLAQYRAGWRKRVPADRQAIMEWRRFKYACTIALHEDHFR